MNSLSLDCQVGDTKARSDVLYVLIVIAVGSLLFALWKLCQIWRVRLLFENPMVTTMDRIEQYLIIQLFLITLSGSLKIVSLFQMHKEFAPMLWTEVSTLN